MPEPEVTTDSSQDVTPRLWIANPLAAWTGNQRDATNGLVVSGNRIVELVAAGQEPAGPVDQVFDASGMVLLPGLINCHHHYYQTLTRAMPAALDRELFDWLKALYPVWAGLDEKAIRLSTQLAATELLMSGCTTSVDHHYVFSEQLGDAIDIQVEALRPLGMRSVLTRGSMSLGQSSGGLPPDSVVQTEQQILDDSQRLIDSYHQADAGAMMQIALAPCSPFSVTSELMSETSRLANKNSVLLHTHLAETEDENRFCLERFGMRPVDYLESVGWMNDRVWLAHGIHFQDQEIRRMGEAGVSVCHCPSSNMILASGQCSVLDLEEVGMAVGLGVDGSASNDHSNMIQEVRQAFLLQRLRYGSQSVSVNDALRWATLGGARLLQRPELGQLAVGKMADLGLFDLDEIRFSGVGDPIAGLITSGAHRARAVMVNGVWQVRDYRPVNIDLEQLLAEHRLCAKALIN